jgi:GxxExxY protein
MASTELDELDPLRERVIGCGIEVHRQLGPGLLESIYRDCLVIELRAAGLGVIRECRVGLDYKGHSIADGLKVDVLVDNRLIVEVKAVEHIHPVHLAQVITYLKLTGCPCGLLMNFNATSLRAGVRRLERPDLYAEKATPTPPP